MYLNGHLSQSTSSRFPTIFPKFREQNYFLLPYKKIFHNRFPYISLYQSNTFSLFLFYSFSYFPTFCHFYHYIIHWVTTVLPNVATQGFRGNIGKLKWVFFVTFFKFFLYLGKGTTYRVSNTSALRTQIY
jgi:hypothetical protein